MDRTTSPSYSYELFGKSNFRIKPHKIKWHFKVNVKLWAPEFSSSHQFTKTEEFVEHIAEDYKFPLNYISSIVCPTSSISEPPYPPGSHIEPNELISFQSPCSVQNSSIWHRSAQTSRIVGWSWAHTDPNWIITTQKTNLLVKCVKHKKGQVRLQQETSFKAVLIP